MLSGGICFSVSRQQTLSVHVFLAATAVSLHPVRLRLHLHQSGDGPLEGEDLLLSCEQSQALCCLLKKGADRKGLAADSLQSHLN